MVAIGEIRRHQSYAVRVGAVTVGGGAPIVVQSMTNTDTADIEATAAQVTALARAGSELVRITVDRDEAAVAERHARLLHTEIFGVRQRADSQQRVRPLHGAAFSGGTRS